MARGGRRSSDRPGRHPNLLIADSYSGARRVCLRYLDHFGFRVAEAADGIQALAKIDADPPQLILIEHSLPAMPAMEMARWLSQRPRTQAIPLIVMTTEFADGERTVIPANVGVLVKPFSLAGMVDKVRQRLRTQVGA